MDMKNRRKLDDMTPREIVASLDEYVIGQEDAKKMIAVAIRNRVRRKALPDEIKNEVTPKNIIMIGPTGVGKTEIARRIARLASAPFIKVEATKYTEVGYVGRDVESMVRDLMASSLNLVKEELYKTRESEVDHKVEERLLDLLLPEVEREKNGQVSEDVIQTREKFRDMLRRGVFDDKEIEIEAKPQMRISGVGVFPASDGQMEDLNNMISDLGSVFGKGRGQKKKVTIKRAREIIKEEELDKLTNNDNVVEEARKRTEEMGIIFIDEIDKIASTGSNSRGDVSREGVQRDILPIVEGTRVNTRWGVIDTTNILFIAAGAFSFSKPSDLIPELQGRFPIRVELSDLSSEDFYRILTEPENALTKQYKALMETEEVTLDFTDDGLRRIADFAHQVNSTTDNIGARRLHTVMEKLLEDVSYEAEKYKGQTVSIDQSYVEDKLKDIVSREDVTRYIL